MTHVVGGFMRLFADGRQLVLELIAKLLQLGKGRLALCIRRAAQLRDERLAVCLKLADQRLHIGWRSRLGPGGVRTSRVVAAALPCAGLMIRVLRREIRRKTRVIRPPLIREAAMRGPVIRPGRTVCPRAAVPVGIRSPAKRIRPGRARVRTAVGERTAVRALRVRGGGQD